MLVRPVAAHCSNAHNTPHVNSSLLPTRVCAVLSAPHSAVYITPVERLWACSLRVKLSNSPLYILLLSHPTSFISTRRTSQHTRLSATSPVRVVRSALCAEYSVRVTHDVMEGMLRICIRDMYSICWSLRWVSCATIRLHRWNAIRSTYLHTSASLSADDIGESHHQVLMLTSRTERHLIAFQEPL